jgi:exonuclease VII large subunit
VVGPVSGVHVTAKGDTFINLGPEYPNHDFTAVVFADDASKFDTLEALEGRTVAVTGTVKEYHGKPEIIVKEPAQLKVK